ncbi:HIT family protein [Ectothiorhodospiraceae bacterium WFHF3C12]|nr:HIT family protein [Ectothiorhodospiraceae bacterium WFHF3C12]
MTFQLDDRLRDDCHVLGRLPAGLVLLHRNAALPWFILVPETDVAELHQLPDALRISLVGAQDGLARFVARRFECHKLNVAALGNQVRQLHVHVIGRFEGDPCWPGPVWGRLPPGPAYGRAELDDLRAGLGDAIAMVPL